MDMSGGDCGHETMNMPEVFSLKMGRTVPGLPGESQFDVLPFGDDERFEHMKP